MRSVVYRVDSIPFLKLLIPFIAGVLIANTIEIGARELLCYCIVCAGVIIVSRHLARFFICPFMVVAGITAMELTSIESIIPKGERIEANLTIEEIIYTSGRWQRSTAHIKSFRPKDGAWQATDEKVMIYIDTISPVAQGDKLLCTAYVNEIDSIYAGTMLSRGITGTMYVTHSRAHKYGERPLSVIEKMRNALIAKISTLPCDDSEKALAMTLFAGEKRTLDRQTKAEYSRTGMSHLLAISGMHLGLLFLILNFALFPLVLLRGGDNIRSIIIVAVLFLYAGVSGFSPSALRAALMLSMMQFTIFGRAQGDSYNVLFASALILLAINPRYLFDLSFQMSYLAMLSILFFYKRLLRFSRNKIVLFFASGVLISIAAQIAVLPLSAYIFGNIPFINIAIMPVVTIILSAVMGLGMLFILTGWQFSGAVLGWILETLNNIVEWAAGVKFAAVSGVKFEENVLYLTYILLLIAAFTIKWLDDRRRV